MMEDDQALENSNNLTPPAGELTKTFTVFEVLPILKADRPLPEIPYYEAVEALLIPNKQPEFHLGDLGEDGPAVIQPQAPIKDFFQPSGRMIEACSNYRGRLITDVVMHPVVAAIRLAFNNHQQRLFGWLQQ